MSTTTYTLRYDGQKFVLSAADCERLRKVYDTRRTLSGILFGFTPVGEDDEVVIAIGSGARFVLRKNVVFS